jgi:histidinol-phosphate aminotransferase
LHDVAFATVPLDENFAIGSTTMWRQWRHHFPEPECADRLPAAAASDRLLLARHRQSVVVVDEAYVDFGASRRWRWSMSTRTCWSCAPCPRRIRWPACASATRSVSELIEALDRVKNSFNSYPLDRLAIAGAVAAIGRPGVFRCDAASVMRSREALCSALSGLGFEVLPSAANFVFVRHRQRDAAELAAALRQRGIIVRHFNLPRIDQHLRITIGTDAQGELLVEALREILA